MESELQTKDLNHLGIVAGMFDELGLESKLNELLDTDGCHREVSLGLIIKALVLNGLGFNQRTLYMASSFFEDKPIEVLLSSDIKASQLNDTVLGRGLDAIHKYGCTVLYSQLVPQIIHTLDLNIKSAHMDSTDFHLEGRYNAGLTDISQHYL